jgi:hypothetical protein
MNETKEPLEQFGGRKFLFAILSTILGFVFVVTGKTTAENWFNFMEIIGATYVIGNVVTKFAPE